jgi:hypothetical protein
MFNVEHAKHEFKSKGWSYRSAGAVLGISYQYLSDVLNGNRTSRRLLVKITALPVRTLPTRTQKINPQLKRKAA